MNKSSTAPLRAQPSTNFKRDQRLGRLRTVRLDLETALRHPTTVIDHEKSVQVERVTAMLIVEMAILNRLAKPADGEEFVALIDQTLDCGVPKAVSLWMQAAPDPMAQFAASLAEHVNRASRLDETRRPHRQLVDPDVLGPLLGLTRARVREIFGDSKCSIRSVKARPDRFDRETSARLNDLADELDLNREHVKDVYAAEGEACFERLREDAAVKRARTEKKLGVKPRRRGRPKKLSSVDALVTSTAKQVRKSPRTIYYRLQAARAACPDPAGYAADADACGLTATDLQLAEIATTEPYARRSRYIDRDVVEEWYLATEGKPLRDDLRRQWMSRHQWFDQVREAKAWKLMQSLRSSESGSHANEANTVRLAQRTQNDGTARPLWSESHDSEAEISEAANAQAAADGC